jgi:hypothetical protein
LRIPRIWALASVFKCFVNWNGIKAFGARFKSLYDTGMGHSSGISEGLGLDLSERFREKNFRLIGRFRKNRK